MVSRQAVHHGAKPTPTEEVVTMKDFLKYEALHENIERIWGSDRLTKVVEKTKRKVDWDN